MAKAIRIGTRSSLLALWQADTVQRLLTAAYPEQVFEQVHINTKGDRETGPPLASFGGVGVFVKEIETALAEDEIDIAVHSLKDVPSTQLGGLVIGAYLEREDPRDALVARTAASLNDLPIGARVATSSVRRRAQLIYARPDLTIKPIRGNVPTRLRKLEDEGLDATILAKAGLVRLGMAEHITEVLNADVMLPAPGQGAVAVELRSADTEILAMVQEALNHPPTAARVCAERSAMRTIGGGCHVPLGALAEIEGNTIRLDAMVASSDGRQVIRTTDRAPVADAEELGIRVANDLIGRGARELIASLDEGN
jgi:hydroxymethylbilane synthase